MFKKYNSIENTYREKQIEQVYLHGYDKEKYVVQEKVHGSNFSFITDGEVIQVAKRSGLIAEDEKFNNYKYVLEKYRTAIEKLYVLVKEKYPTITEVTVYGEIFGGSYEHPEVSKSKGMSRIQKGVFYTPDNDFYAFDIRVDHDVYLNVDEANELFETVGLFYAKSLFEGSFKDCLAYSNEFDSKIPGWLGLPDIKDNTCEGVVIKPVASKIFKNGTRVIFKNKNEKWSERSHATTRIRKITVVSFSDKEKETLEKLMSYINENRLMNVQSKLGDFEPKQTGKTIGLLSQDAFVDFKKDYEDEWNTIEKERQKLFTKALNKEAVSLVKEVLLFK